MRQFSTRAAMLAIATSGALLCGCATTVDMGPGYYRYDSRIADGTKPAVVQQAPTAVEPAVVYREPAVVYREPTVVYRESATVYREPTVIYREPAIASPEGSRNYYYHDHGQ